MGKYWVTNVLEEGSAGQAGQCKIQLHRREMRNGEAFSVLAGRGTGMVVAECREGGRRMVSLDGITYASKREMELFRAHAQEQGAGAFGLLCHMVQEAPCPELPIGVGQYREGAGKVRCSVTDALQHACSSDPRRELPMVHVGENQEDQGGVTM